MIIIINSFRHNFPANCCLHFAFNLAFTLVNDFGNATALIITKESEPRQLESHDFVDRLQ